MEWKEFELYRSCDRTDWVFSLLLPLFLSNLLLDFLSLSMCLSVCLFPNRKLEYALIALDCHTIHGLVKCDLMPSMNSKMFTIQNQFHAFILHLHSSLKQIYEWEWRNGGKPKENGTQSNYACCCCTNVIYGGVFFLLLSNWNLCKCLCFNKFHLQQNWIILSSNLFGIFFVSMQW